MDFNVYNDIEKRTKGEIYIGVVGPVRTGKSTFIKNFMDVAVMPNIKDENEVKRAMDELPQSSAILPNAIDCTLTAVPHE